MENRKYLVSRNDVYVGEVINTISGIYRLDDDCGFFGAKAGELDVSCWSSYRSMLFTLNDEKMSNDLLYNSPSYPVLNFTDDNICLGLGDGSTIIKGACCLGELLEYFGYDSELSYKDVVSARNTFFTGRFAKDNCELFGWKEFMPEEATYFEDGIEITDPKKLKRILARVERDRQRGHRSFMGVSEHVLSRDYWDVLDKLGDNSVSDILGGWCSKIDSFKPSVYESHVKKLRRF